MRTTLTLGSFAVALFLFCLLVTIRAAFNQGVDVAGADRLLVINKVSIIQPLPIAYRERCCACPGVKEVTFANWFGGVYQDEKNFFPQFAIDAETYRDDVHRSSSSPDDQWQAFLADKQGAVVGKATAERFGWKVGDRIPIKGADLPRRLGVQHPRHLHGHGGRNDDLTQFWFRWDYLEGEGARPGREQRGLVRRAHRIPAPTASQVAKAIDEQFANSAWETRDPDRERRSWPRSSKQMGNIEFLMMAIGSVVFFTLLLVTGNTMAISVRERTGELAVLKTVGFTRRRSCWPWSWSSRCWSPRSGAAWASAWPSSSRSRGDPTKGMLAELLPARRRRSRPGPRWRSSVGLVAGLLPALSAMRLQVVDALRRL